MAQNNPNDPQREDPKKHAQPGQQPKDPQNPDKQAQPGREKQNPDQNRPD